MAGVFYPIATNAKKPDVLTNFELNLLYGRVGALDGVGIGMANAIDSDANGFVAGALVNRAGGRASGLHVAGLFNSADSLDQGVMLALLLNHTRAAVHGGQAAFGLNFAGPVHGAQAAGFMNISSGAVEGVELAFAGNVAREFQGLQASGLMNVAGDLDGVQLGLVNVADDVEGVPFGLVNVTRSGGVHALVWGGYTTHANVGLKFATRYTYTFLSFAIHRKDDHTQLGPGLGLGFSVPVVDKRLYFEPDLSAQHLFGDTECCEKKFFGAIERRRDQSQFKVRAALRAQVAKHLSFFAGGGAVGSLRYPLDAENDTDYRFGTYLEAFGGVQL